MSAAARPKKGDLIAVEAQKVRGDGGPPNWILKELVEAGAIDPAVVRLPREDRCKCGHVLPAHVGACGAHRCKCPEYRQDPEYVIPRPTEETRRIRKHRMIKREDGTIEIGRGV